MTKIRVILTLLFFAVTVLFLIMSPVFVLILSLI